MNANTIDANVKKIIPICEYCDNKGIPYLYLTSILPIVDENDLPYSSLDYSHMNAERLRDELTTHGVNIFDLRQLNVGEKEKLFYRTDHHWTTDTTFAVFEALAEKLQIQIEEPLDYTEYIILQSFLGSYGIKVGKYYTGKDDFKILIPENQGQYTFESYDADGSLVMKKTGPWFDTMIDQEMLENNEYNNKYNSWLYTQAIENRIINQEASNDTKLLFISHSYGRPLAAYLSTCIHEVRQLDPQKGRFTGNYLDYIDEYEPDIVLFLCEFEGDLIGEYNTERSEGLGDEIAVEGNTNTEGAFNFEAGRRDTNSTKLITLFSELESYLLPVDEAGQIDFNSINITDHQFIAYCLKAECKVGNQGKIRELTQYLLDHSDEDGDGILGWGLLFEWDAFSDGSINPSGQVYATEVGNVIEAFLDAIDSEMMTEGQVAEVKNIIHQVIMDWNINYWTDENETGKDFYWYSTSPADNIECVNISSKMSGVFARAVCAETFTDEEKDTVYHHIDACIKRILEVAQYTDGFITWPYLTRNESTNDSIHHAFILEGLSGYKEFRGLDADYDIQDYTDYIAACVDDSFIYSTPEHSSDRCFNTDAVRWLNNRDLEGEILLNSCEKYFNDKTDIRQLAFLFNAIGRFIAD